MAYNYRQQSPGMPPQLGGPASAYGVPPGYGLGPPYASGHSLHSSPAYQGFSQYGAAQSTRAPSYSQLHNYVAGAVSGSWSGNSASSSPWMGAATHAGTMHHPDDDLYSRYSGGSASQQRWPTPGRTGTPRRNAPTPPVPPSWAHDHAYDWRDPRAFPASAPRAEFDPCVSNLGSETACLSWEVRNDDGIWHPWIPGVPFHGLPREEVHFRVGPWSYLAIFDTADSGVELNLTTGGRRLMRRRVPDRARPSSRGPLASETPAWMRNSSPGPAMAGAHRRRPSSRGPSAVDTPAWMRDSSPGPPAVGSSAGRHSPCRTPIAEPSAQMRSSPGKVGQGSSRLEQARAGDEALRPHATAGGEVDAAAANALASEAYRELQKLGSSGKSEPSTDLPDVIALGDGALGSGSIALGNGPVSTPAKSVEATTMPRAQGRAQAEKADRGPMGALEDLQMQVRAVEESVLEVDRALNSSKLAPGQARDQLAQLEACLSHLQCNGIDSVSCAGLTGSDAEEARARRKALTQQTERLHSCLDSMFARIKVMRKASGQC